MYVIYLTKLMIKIRLTKRWNYYCMGGKSYYPKGLVVTGKKHPEGLLIDHFYCYGQNEIIPNEYFKVIS